MEMKKKISLPFGSDKQHHQKNWAYQIVYPVFSYNALLSQRLQFVLQVCERISIIHETIQKLDERGGSVLHEVGTWQRDLGRSFLVYSKKSAKLNLAYTSIRYMYVGWYWISTKVIEL